VEEDGVMKPLISFLHVIPLEERDLPHCAQLCCWCSPVPDKKDPVIILHKAMTQTEDWVIVGEMTMPIEDGDE
jgi:hypothetical protein